MEIKVEKVLQSVLVDVVTYVAKDGTHFLHENECIEYEKIIADVEQIITMSSADGFMNIVDSEQCPNSAFRWYFPKTKDHLRFLHTYYDPVDADSSFNESHLEKWICVEDYGGGADVTTLDDGIEYAKKLLNIFGYDIVKKEGELK